MHHCNWISHFYSTYKDSEFLVDWASASDATLLFDPKELATFISGRWKTETNLDLAFAKVRSQEPLPVRRASWTVPPVLSTFRGVAEPTTSVLGRPV